MGDIVTTLRERPYRLASESNTEMQVRRQAEREYAAHEIEVLRLEKAKLVAENERLRQVLDNVQQARVLQGKAITEASNEIERLRAALREAYEVYAGSDGFIPETAGEGYQQQIIRQMVDCISAALEGK